MKKLSILRHGKSSWENPNVDDIDRPLLPKGVKRTQKICKYMKTNGIIPDCVISSPAARAMQTSNIVIEELNLSLYAQISKKLYPGSVDRILDLIAEVDRNIKHILIVGHNPVLTDLAVKISNNFKTEWLPTSGLVTVELEMKGWEFVLGEKGKCLHYVLPKGLSKS